MFRQVVAIRWAEGVTLEAKHEFREALDGLRAIPQLRAMTWGDDAGHFDDNFDLVAVQDFDDFASARVYVAHPLHQAYIRDHASKVIGQRVIVQHEWSASEPAVEIRGLDPTELSRVAEIDRTERIDTQYVQHGTELVARHGTWNARPWDPDGHGEHSVEAQVHMLEHYAEAGGIALGAFAGEPLVGIGVVVPHLRPGIAQLAYLHVSAPFRATGIGSRLCEQLDEIAQTAGDSEMVVTATPSENTVRFYLGRGFQPMAEPFAELFELEPEDVHMRKVL